MDLFWFQDLALVPNTKLLFVFDNVIFQREVLIWLGQPRINTVCQTDCPVVFHLTNISDLILDVKAASGVYVTIYLKAIITQHIYVWKPHASITEAFSMVTVH